jgi:hypothetical protein
MSLGRARAAQRLDVVQHRLLLVNKAVSAPLETDGR